MYDTSPMSCSLDSPMALQESVLDYICDNLEAVCVDAPPPPPADEDDETASTSSNSSSSTTAGEGWRGLRFPSDADFYLHEKISEQLIVKLCERKKMTDVVLTLFDCSRTRLRHVRLSDAAKLSHRGLRTLKGHKIVELEAVGLSKATVTDLIGCLGEWTLQNLRSLNVANSTFVDQNKYTIVVALSQLQSLQTLNVSGTEFNKRSLELVASDLPQLEHLDISCTKVSDIAALARCKDKLKSLSMYGLKLPASSSETVVATLTELSELRHLDISDDREDHPFDVLAANDGRLKVAELLQHTAALPKLVSLDISGKEEIQIPELKAFLSDHTLLQFLGLVLTDACKEDMFVDGAHPLFRKELVVAGSANESQLFEALKRYLARPQYVQKSLYYLFRQTQGYPHPRLDLIKLVLDAAHSFKTVFAIQMAATACLFNLSKGELGQRLHPRVLGRIVETDLDAMEQFPQHQQLQKNVLLTICSDRILQEVHFNKYRCAKLVMDCLCAWPDHSMNRMSVAICSILAAKISTEETSELGSHADYMKKLLQIVRGRMEDINIDITMKFTLSALWNLTDESPKTCSVFLAEGGMELFLQVLEAFPGEQSIETKILGLLNNIAEVQHLRTSIMCDPFVNILRKLLHSKHIDVSYFAAGIVAHLASDGPETWLVETITKEDLVRDLWYVVRNWKTPKDEMVAYRSFKPFFPLMSIGQLYAVQLWAVWAIHHVCTKSPARYCSMLSTQGGDEVLLRLLRAPDVHESVKHIAHQVVATLVDNGYLLERVLLEQQPKLGDESEAAMQQ